MCLAAAGSGITNPRAGDCDSGREVLAVAREDDYIELERALSEISYPCGKDELLMFADDSERYQSGEPLA
jgi:hypothetical protein